MSRSAGERRDRTAAMSQSTSIGTLLSGAGTRSAMSSSERGKRSAARRSAFAILRVALRQMRENQASNAYSPVAFERSNVDADRQARHHAERSASSAS